MLTTTRRHAPAVARIMPLVIALGAVLAMTAGCSEGAFSFDLFKKKRLPPEPRPLSQAPPNEIIDPTIGQRAVLSDALPVRLQGFGVVVGLGDTGGSDCPSSVREYLLDYFAKRFAATSTRRELPISPARLIDSPDSAVVRIEGFVPAGAPAGAPFDIALEVLGAEARSLEGGVLLAAELKEFAQSRTTSGIIAGRTLAIGQGPIFTNPFGQDGDDRGFGSPRRGVVLGGGKSNAPRNVRLLLETPSYATARRIEQRVNERFGQRPAVAEAISAGFVELRTPPYYQDQPQHFIDVVLHLDLDGSPPFIEERFRTLSGMLDYDPDDLEHIALVWEGMGRTIISKIQPLYDHPRAAVRYLAARTGVRLGDGSAIAPLAEIATQSNHDYQLPAIYELGQTTMPRAALTLVDLLDNPDSTMRITAYEGLRRQRHPAVRTQRFPFDANERWLNFELDVIQSAGPPMIYVKRQKEPRIAVFGANVAVKTPLFYSHADEWVVLNANEGAARVTMMRRTRQPGVMSDAVKAAPRVADLVRKLAALPLRAADGGFEGLGLHYAIVVEVLNDLCGDKTIDAEIVFEPPASLDLLGPREYPERPESDEPPTRSEPEPIDGQPDAATDVA